MSLILYFCLDFWRSIDGFGRGDVTLLAAMLVNMIVIICLKFYRYSIARRQTRVFAHDATAAMRDGRFHEVLAIATRNGRSPVASVVAAGLTAFASRPPQITHNEAIETADRAIQRSRKMQGAELKVGLATFTTIASSAPFIGLLGTCFGILYAFRGYVGEKHTWIVRVNSDIARALVSLAMGLFVAVLAMWCRNYLRNCIELFKTEMWNAAIETVTHLNAHRLWHNHHEHSAVGTMVVASVTATRSWEVPYDRQRVVLLAIWMYWLYMVTSSVLR